MLSKAISRSSQGSGTSSIWGGEKVNWGNHSSRVPIYLTNGYKYDDLDEMLEVSEGKKFDYIYSRNDNPTVNVLEEKIKILEGAEDGTSFSTGMAAISNTFYTILEPGDSIVSIIGTYGGTNKLFREFLPKIKVNVHLCGTTDYECIEKYLEDRPKLLHIETPTNPSIKILDIKRLVNSAHLNGTIVTVDNTFATPINQNPIQLGADIVIHSASKYICGHADALGGLIAGRRDLVRKIYHYREENGAALDPSSAYLILRGMKTLEVRMKRHNENALEVAKFLRELQDVEEVRYPGLSDYPYYDIARSQMRGFGGMLSFVVKGGLSRAKRFLPRLKFALIEGNLGSVETIAAIPQVSSHIRFSREELNSIDIPDGLIRYSVGLENTEDLKGDLENALRESR
ncbi:MAG: PLP-dependent transferase [Candidatus Thermoplasmatota archaeon]|jgi:cystathionine gamma-synthase|nr:PLP-dependent transferase [Candidatus Thermoplasmatota archaeon]